MIPLPFLDVLRKIHLRLSNTDLDWAVVGSLGLGLRGAPTEPKDIDIMTDKSGAYELERLFSDFVVSPISLRSTSSIQSYFGSFVIDGIKVEVMGDFRVRGEDGTWHGPPDLRQLIETVSVEGMSIPVLSLEWERESYLALGRKDKAEMVKGLTAKGGRQARVR